MAGAYRRARTTRTSSFSRASATTSATVPRTWCAHSPWSPTRTFVLDGELIAVAPDGRPSFEATGSARQRHCLCAFDLLWLMGEDLRPLPLSERQRRLTALLHGASPCLYVVEGFEDPVRLLAAVEKHGLEGIVSKRIDAPYRSGSRSGWIKVKTAAWREANQDRLEAIRNSVRR
jgi:ATP-dependent DNA ligase